MSHLPDPRRRPILFRMIQRIHHRIAHTLRPPVAHIVRQVIQVEQVRQEIVAHAQLRVCGVRVGHRCEGARLQAVVLVTRFPLEAVTLEEPPLRLGSDALVVPVLAQGERAVRYEIWKYEFSRP